MTPGELLIDPGQHDLNVGRRTCTVVVQNASDRPILQRALAERNFPYLGAIGSAAKATVLRRELVAHGLTPERAENFFCPIGEPIGSNHPHEIALSIAAQLLRVRDALTP